METGSRPSSLKDGITRCVIRGWGGKMNDNYAMLTDRNREIVDSFIDFLVERQKKHEKELLDAVRECENGDCIGPFNSVDELMEELDKP